MKSVQDFQKDIEELAISWGEALKIGDYRTANKQNSTITRIAKKFRKDKNLGESILVPLLQHTNPSVRLLASVHVLDQGIHIQEAESTLINIASDPNIHVINLMAQINLSQWNKKKATVHYDKTS
jgi:hypothetical protein